MKQVILTTFLALASIPAFSQWTEVGKISTTSTGTIGAGNFNNSYIYISDGTQKLGLDPNQIYSGQELVVHAGGFLALNSGNSERMRLLSNGKIGIGTTSPSSSLHISSSDYKNFLTLDRTSRPEVQNLFHLTPSWDNDQNDQLRIVTNNTEIVTFEETGNVGIGTLNPIARLSVQSVGTIGTGNYENSSIYITDGNQKLGIDPNQIYSGQELVVNAGGFLAMNSGNTERMRILANGNIGIGTTSTGSHKLAVDGSIGAREIKVEATGWSDFVFENGYDLRTLEEVEQHINAKGHLPEIPSEAEVTENGINLGEMDAKLLQKIEELTLYLIEQNKEIKELKEKVKSLENK
ncbi:MAG: hypothetical protein KI790_20085 [Cyclobacteriaceae bacterium]|nr:hypothetical protein [Cyclobacteriaceae bacterium HetDA_MAG_MS6]